ncbi:MLO-like protein 1 [Helianthus annuus]|uniref:MLO-like protein 1 n=1 Tax=Helianthus annuus TaxID=4232 RepID=UPI001652DF5A|nr:MLO-like protein 1 [Helianthus annuus]
MAGGGEGNSLEFTPTWVVAAICTVIVGISLAVERLLHYTGKKLKKSGQKPLFEALQKIKEELMLLGFISLLLTVFQSRIVKICVNESLMEHLLPCSLSDKKKASYPKPLKGTSHIRHLLAGEATTMGYCASKNKVPLLSLEALHHLHIFIFVLAVVHVTFSVLTVVFGVTKIRQWKQWEESIAKDNFDASQVLKHKVTQVKDNDFIRNRFLGIGKRSTIRGWLHSFFKQFYGSVTKSDYVALRLGFITTHCKANPKFNFHKYMIRALEDDFKKVVGISWYLWVFVVLFLFMNVNGLELYFWLSLIPFFLLLAVGTKLEHIIIQLAHEVAEKHVAIEGELVVHPSDDHFWFQRPKIVLFFIHFILFQNAFEFAFFFWVWAQYGFDSCIMGKVSYIIPRLIIGVFIQVLCSYSTLPLYALVTQMGTHFKKSIFEEHIQAKVVGWAQHAKCRSRFSRRIRYVTYPCLSQTLSRVRNPRKGANQTNVKRVAQTNNQRFTWIKKTRTFTNIYTQCLSINSQVSICSHPLSVCVFTVFALKSIQTCLFCALDVSVCCECLYSEAMTKSSGP